MGNLIMIHLVIRKLKTKQNTYGPMRCDYKYFKLIVSRVTIPHLKPRDCPICGLFLIIHQLANGRKSPSKQ